MTAYQQLLSLVFIALCLLGCAPKGRYYQEHDSAPHIIPSQVTTEDAVPSYVPYAKANLRPYTIRGVKYHPLTSGKGYSKEGYASWYGQKFHGHRTSNGEIYDMYQMSAAHKTLPLPSYARITNLENGKQVVVKINDRGPFHSNRLIDLSYAAARKLDIIKTGIGKVKLDVIHVDKNGLITLGNQASQPEQPKHKMFIQVAALQNKAKIEKLAQGLQALYQLPYQAKQQDNIYKLQLGPINDEVQGQAVLQELKSNGFPEAYKVYVN
jgi:rare lipoprotein A